MFNVASVSWKYDSLVNHQANLNQYRIAWWLGLPALSGGKYFYDLYERNPGTLTSISSSSYGWQPITRPGGSVGIKLDGNGQYISVDDNAIFKFGTSDFTVSGWFYLDTLNNTNSNGRQTVISRYESANTKGWSIDINTTGQLVFRIQESAIVFNDFASSTNAVVANTWYHFMATRTGINSFLYLNGKLESSGTSVSALDISSGSSAQVLLGEMVTNGGTHQYLQGYIDDISIYNSSLGSSYAQRLYDESVSEYPTTLNKIQSSRTFPIASPWVYYNMLQNSYGVSL
jgi:hypothetical protein